MIGDTSILNPTPTESEHSATSKTTIASAIETQVIDIHDFPGSLSLR